MKPTSFERFPFNNGGSIPTIGFGTGTTFFNRNDEVAEGIVKAIKVGYRLVDTAVMYGTEEGAGKGIKMAIEQGLVKREELFVTTKIAPKDKSIEGVSDFITD